MKLKMKLKMTGVLSLFLIFVSLSSVSQNRELSESLNEFKELKISNGLEVQVIPSEENRIEITGHSKHEVKFNVVENRLEIKLSLDNLWSKDDTKITVYGKNIEIIDAHQGSLVEVSGHLKGEELTFKAQGGANIRAAVNASKIVSKAVTGGKIYLEGKANKQDVDLNTGGNFFGRDLRTKETVVKSGTAAKGEIYATEYVRATASLGGTVEIFGRPQEVEQKTSLGGRIL